MRRRVCGCWRRCAPAVPHAGAPWQSFPQTAPGTPAAGKRSPTPAPPPRWLRAAAGRSAPARRRPVVRRAAGLLSRSNSLSRVTRNVAAASGRSSNRVSGLNSAGILVVVLFMFFLSFGFGVKTKNPRLTGNRGFLKSVSVGSAFHSTMPERRDSRWQMAIQPLTGAVL